MCMYGRDQKRLRNFLYEVALYGLCNKILKIGRIELFATVMSLWGF
jgi:hypothetical protein